MYYKVLLDEQYNVISINEIKYFDDDYLNIAGFHFRKNGDENTDCYIKWDLFRSNKYVNEAKNLEKIKSQVTDYIRQKKINDILY